MAPGLGFGRGHGAIFFSRQRPIWHGYAKSADTVTPRQRSATSIVLVDAMRWCGSLASEKPLRRANPRESLQKSGRRRRRPVGSVARLGEQSSFCERSGPFWTVLLFARGCVDFLHENHAQSQDQPRPRLGHRRRGVRIGVPRRSQTMSSRSCSVNSLFTVSP